MPYLDTIRNTFLRSLPMTSIEQNVLETLISMKSGSAYSIWKVSGIKHYPTVLRSLKKLEKKRCVEIIDDRMRGRSKRLYVPTALGKLTNYILREEIAQVTKTIALSSPRFQAIVNAKVEEIDVWAYSIARDILYHMDEEKPKIDDIVKNKISIYLGDDLLNIQDPKSRDEIFQLTKVEWIRELAIEETESEIRRCKKQFEELRKLKETLTTNYEEKA